MGRERQPGRQVYRRGQQKEGLWLRAWEVTVKGDVEGQEGLIFMVYVYPFPVKEPEFISLFSLCHLTFKLGRVLFRTS